MSDAGRPRGIGGPRILVIGYGSRTGDPPALQAAPRLGKPFGLDELAERMTAAFISDSNR